MLQNRGSKDEYLKLRRRLLLPNIFLLLLFSQTTALSSISPVQGITENQIVFGQSAALTGVAKDLGINMRAGLRAAFEEVNKKGGVYGRKLRLVTKDDGYEPELSISNIHDLMKNEKVFAFVGGVGTPTSKAAVPIVAKNSLLYIGPFTGASFLRSSYLDSVINVRASYFQETKEMVSRLKEDLKINRIAVLYQNDSYGLDGLNGVKKAVESLKGVEIVSLGTYVRNTIAVKTALLDIKAKKPQAVIIIGSYLPAAVFIKWAKKLKMHSTVFMAVSFVGVSSLAKELKDSNAHVFVTQVVPYPYHTKNLLQVNYQKAIKEIKAWDQVGFISLEGYVVGRLVIEALKRVGKKPNRKKFLAAFKHEKKKFDIDGLKLSYGKSDNQGSDQVFITKIKDGKVLSVENLRK